MYREVSESVLLVGVEGEAEMMFAQHIAHENQSYALPVGLCGEERREEFLFHFGTYAVVALSVISRVRPSRLMVIVPSCPMLSAEFFTMLVSTCSNKDSSIGAVMLS